MGGYLTQPLKRANLLNPQGTATIDGDRQRNWAEVYDRVARLAAGLRSLDLQDGDRVAILAFSSDRYFELMFALPWANLVMVPLNSRLSPPELEYMLRDSDAAAICVDATHRKVLDAIPEARDSLRAIISLDDDGPAPSHEGLIARHAPAPDNAPGGESMAALYYTGGSTGRAKGVMLTHNNLLSNAVNTVIGVGYASDSVYLHAAPMFHLTDGMSTYSLTSVGGTHVFIPRFDARAVLETVQKRRVTNLCLVPTMIEMLVSVAETESFDLSSLRQFQFGSSPMPVATLQRAVALWPDMLFLHGWGMTELSPVGLFLPLELRNPGVAGDRLRSCGVPPHNQDTMIVDPLGNPVPPNVVGELIVRGPMVMKGYWKKPEETAKALRNGWMYTGDAAYRDDEGLFYIADRLKDMIISGGENVYSTEVENVIGQYPGVKQVAVVGLPHPKWGESVHAVVVPRDGAEISFEALREFVKSRIAAYKAPRSLSIRHDPLPQTSGGKIFKRALRDEYASLQPAD